MMEPPGDPTAIPLGASSASVDVMQSGHPKRRRPAGLLLANPTPAREEGTRKGGGGRGSGRGAIKHVLGPLIAVARGQGRRGREMTIPGPWVHPPFAGLYETSRPRDPTLQPSQLGARTGVGEEVGLSGTAACDDDLLVGLVSPSNAGGTMASYASGFSLRGQYPLPVI